MKADSAEPAIQPLQSLPRDKKTLDFILKKLSENSSPARYNLLEELLERHRTSIGFDPFVLSKGRFKRFRSAEIKQVLAEIEQELKIITSSGEYLQFLEDSTRHQALIEHYSNVVSLLTAPPTKELNDQVDQFIAYLEREQAYELLLSFFRQADKHFLSRSKGLEKVIETYSSLLLKLDLRNNLLISGLQTALLLQQALRVNVSQERLLLHFNCLIALFDKSENESEKVDVVQQLIRVGLYLDQRVKHISPFLKSVSYSSREMRPDEEKSRIEILTAAYIYDTTVILPERKRNILLLEEKSKDFSDKQPVVYIKYGRALLEAESGNYDESARILNEAEHLLYRNGFKSGFKKEWIEICILRYYIYVMSEKVNKAQYEEAEYEGIIKMLRDALSDHSSLNATINGLTGVKEFIKGNHEKAGSHLKNAIEDEKNPPARYNYLIFNSILLSITENNNVKKLNENMEDLAELNEPFYSTMLEGLLQMQ